MIFAVDPVHLTSVWKYYLMSQITQASENSHLPLNYSLRIFVMYPSTPFSTNSGGLLRGYFCVASFKNNFNKVV